jgi:hypothetical protein
MLHQQPNGQLQIYIQYKQQIKNETNEYNKYNNKQVIMKIT